MGEIPDTQCTSMVYLPTPAIKIHKNWPNVGIYIYTYKWVFLNCLKSKCSAHRIRLPKGETFVAESKERLAKAGFRQTLGVFLLMEG